MAIPYAPNEHNNLYQSPLKGTVISLQSILLCYETPCNYLKILEILGEIIVQKIHDKSLIGPLSYMYLFGNSPCNLGIAYIGKC